MNKFYGIQIVPQNSHYKEKGKETRERFSLALQLVQEGEQEGQPGGSVSPQRTGAA